jgi:flavin-dependent dehydrogenase
VTLFEKDKIPRHKHCAGYVSSRSMKLLNRIFIDCTPIIRQPINGFKIKCEDKYYNFFPEEKKVEGGNVHHEEFDTFLLECAQESGAKILDSTRITGIKENENGYSVISSNVSEKCDIIVGADGVNSFTRKQLDLEYNMKKIGVALETEIKVEQEVFDYYNSMNFYNMGAFNCGYSWIFPKQKGSTVNAGICIWIKEAKKMNITLIEMLNSFLEGLEWYKRQKIEPHGHLIPFMGTLRKLGKGNIILTGDAARAIQKRFD